MFALPGITLLIVFILARPQEALPVLQRVPFLHLFAVLTVLGYVVDVRLRRLEPIATNTLPWVIALLLWAILSTAINASDQLAPRILEMAILFVLYGAIAHGVQRFRTFQAVSAVLATTCVFITAVCLHQGFAQRQCIAGEEEQEGEIQGKPDGRECEIAEQCRGPDAEPGLEYQCEHVGVFGTSSVADRVRYRGELQDPNEVALTISAAMALVIGFVLRKRRSAAVFPFVLAIGAISVTVVLTQSRGGLIAAMLVPGVFIVWRYGLAAAIPAAGIALVMMLLAGRGGEAATMSTELRYEAWATGLDMWHHSPIYGIGARMFVEHHFLTAHNSYVLMLAELGMVGLILFVAILYLCLKTLIVGLRELALVPGTAAAQVWGVSLLAAMSGIAFQISTLSFAYHPVLWLYLGLVGAWYSAVRHHRPQLRIVLGMRDLVIIGIACVTYAVGFLPVFLRAKGYV